MPPVGGLLCKQGVADLHADPWLFCMPITKSCANNRKREECMLRRAKVIGLWLMGELPPALRLEEVMPNLKELQRD